ncbi:MAG: Uma2 family endonuclease [Cyanobacteria bacterium SBLK]|nr:Uma2 family endonuclease [Cyanobacteria bacterium SBLK]
MYDLPSEKVGEPGLPDQFHPLQAELLRLTFRPSTYPSERVFSAMDMNLYYDENNTRRYKRPDWFGVVGASEFYEERDLRLSYVVWQEGVIPFIVVELLSPSTRSQDLGQVDAEPDKNPTKWVVYEEILQIPYYVVYSREQDDFQVFHLENNRYRELRLENNRLWFEALGLGMGLWQGSYENHTRLWLRFYDTEGNWIPTPEEYERREKELAQQQAELAQQQAELAQQQAELAQQEIENLKRLLRENNIDFNA